MNPYEPLRIGAHNDQDEEEQPKWHRTSLSLFPVYALREVTMCLSGFSVLTLYNCGSALLNHKLRKIGAVTQFSVRYGMDHYLPYRDWRNNNFRSIAIFRSLRRLEFVGFSNYSFRNFSTVVIAQFTPNLVAIKFDFIESLTMWIELRAEAYGLKKFHYASIPNLKAFSMEDSFPQLEELHLSSNYWDRYSIYPTPKECYGFSWTHELKSEFIKHIPRTVTDLHITSAMGPAAGTLFPPNVQRLNWTVCDMGSYRVDQYNTSDVGASIPREVVHLRLRQLRETPGKRGLLHQLKDLPDTLETLEICADAMEVDDDFSPTTLPPHLLSLRLLTTPLPEFTNRTISLLPSTLTVLDLYDVPCLKDDSMPLFPASLTILKLAPNNKTPKTGLTHACLLDAPKGLVEFVTSSSVLWPWSALEYLPPALKLLEHHSFEYASTPDQEKASKKAATDYWKGKAAEVGCILRFTFWDKTQAEVDAEAAERRGLAPHNFAPPPPDSDNEDPESDHSELSDEE